MIEMFIAALCVAIVVGFIGISLAREGDNFFAVALGVLLIAGMGALLYTSAVIAFGPERLAVDHTKCEAYAWQEVDRKWVCLNGEE